MKHIILTFLALIFSFNVLAEKIISKVDSIDIGRDQEDHLVKLTSGRVAFIAYGEKFLLKQIQTYHENNEWLELVLDNRSTLISVRVTDPIVSNEEFSLAPNRNEPYRPTVVTSTGARNIFIRMRRDYKSEGQCFNRAHIWTYEEHQRNKTNLNKVFLFFTSLYIRTYRFGWWFHVTPMAYVGGTTSSSWRMLDRRYTSGPLLSKTWTDVFIKSKKTCKIVTKYSSYRENQRSQHCYLIQAPMYYVVPSDLARLEETGEERLTYEEVEVEHAYWDAFKNMPSPI